MRRKQHNLTESIVKKKRKRLEKNLGEIIFKDVVFVDAQYYIQAFSDYLSSASDSFNYNRDFLYLHYKDFIAYVGIVDSVKTILFELQEISMKVSLIKKAIDEERIDPTKMSFSIPVLGLFCDLDRNLYWKQVPIVLEKPSNLTVALNIDDVGHNFHKLYFPDEKGEKKFDYSAITNDLYYQIKNRINA